MTAVEHHGPRDLLRGRGGTVLRELLASDATVLSCDVFDTVLLRDGSTETQRLARASTRAAELLGIDARALTHLRWLSQQNAYRAVAMERPRGDARLWDMCLASVAPFALGSDAAQILHDVELEIDASHLTAKRTLLADIEHAKSAGIRVIAVSDIYYSEADLHTLLISVIGADPFDAIYASSDIGATKATGGIFGEVTARENVEPAEVFHVGDSLTSDVINARAAGWNALHAPRNGAHRVERLIGRARTLRTRAERDR